MSVDAEQATPDEPVADSAETTVATPDPAPEVDFEQRFKDTQAAFTRSQQTLADEEQLLAHIAEKFPHLIAEDDDEDLDPDPDPEPAQAQPDPRVDQVDQRLQAIEAKEKQKEFESDFAELLAKREITPEVREIIELRTIALGNNREALGKAMTEWFALEEQLREPKNVKRPRAPHVTPPGTNPSEGKAPEEKTHQERVASMVARANAEQG